MLHDHRMLILGLLLAFTSPATADPPPSVALADRHSGEPRLQFVALDAATSSGGDGAGHLDLGTVSAAHSPSRRRDLLLQRRIALRIDHPAAKGTTVRLSVALDHDTPGCTVRVDGIVVTTLPRLVDAVHRVGSPVVHEIEITIPAGVPAGAFVSQLRWLVDSD